MNIIRRVNFVVVLSLAVAIGLHSTVYAQQEQPAAAAAAAAGGESSSDLDKVIKGGVVASDTPLSDIVSLIQAETGAQIILGENVGQKQVNFNLTGNPTLRDVLDTVLPTVGMDYAVQDNGVLLIDTEENISIVKAPTVELIERSISPDYIDVSVLEQAFNNLKSPEGTILVDPDSQQIIVTDLPEIVESMMNYAKQLDVPVETRVFPIKYGNAQEIADQLQGIIFTGEGELIVDYRNNTIIIRDTIDRLQMAETIINQLDVELFPAVIPLAFALPEDVIPLVETLMTENGMIDFDYRTSRLIVQDIPSVVDQIKQMVEMLDIPTQQIWCEVDIVRISNDRSLTLGVNGDWGKDVGANGDPSSPSIQSGSSSSFFTFNPFLSTSGSGITLQDVNQGLYRIQVDAMVKRHEAEVIASPRLLIEDGETGSFTLGSQEPFAVRQQQSFFNSGSSGDYFTQQFREVGTTVYLEVYASEAGYIEMFIEIEDSNARRVDLPNLGSGLAVDGSFLNTAITVKSGRTVVLGGIINRDQSKQENGVPILRSIPVLGNLFKSKSNSDEKQKLLVFITPKLVNIDDPYDFAQIDNIQHVKELRKKGATGFVESEVPKQYIDWSNEKENEQEAIDEYLKSQGMSANDAKQQNGGRKTSSRTPSIKEQKESGIMLIESKK